MANHKCVSGDVLCVLHVGEQLPESLVLHRDQADTHEDGRGGKRPKAADQSEAAILVCPFPAQKKKKEDDLSSPGKRACPSVYHGDRGRHCWIRGGPSIGADERGALGSGVRKAGSGRPRGDTGGRRQHSARQRGPGTRTGRGGGRLAGEAEEEEVGRKHA